MNNFTIRVVLRNNASVADYENLHAQMEARLFYRKIQGGNGIWYDLPPAEYQCVSGGSLDQIRDTVVQIARQVDSNIRVRVTEGQSAWAGLERSAHQGGAAVLPAPTFNYLPSPFPAPTSDP